jgi:cobalt transporter subunit CbtA
MIRRMLAGGLIAGFAAGLLAALLHFAFVQDLILLGEQYESGALVHLETSGAAPAAAGHDHAAGEAAGSHVHGAADPGAESAFQRNALTVLFTALIYAAYGILLVAGFAVAEQFGRTVSPGEGLLWGLAGFAAFQLAPAMGLPPELPGSVAADLGARQMWWLATVVATGGGLALLGYGRTALSAALGGALLAAPHVVGAPQLDQFYGVAPPELAATFAARVLGVGFVVWAALGWLAGRLWSSASA